MNKKTFMAGTALLACAFSCSRLEPDMSSGSNDGSGDLAATKSALSQITETLQNMVEEEYYIPDYSRCGYHYSDESIPYVPVFKTLTAKEGDMTAEIQAAILSAEKNGGGAILLKAGTYNISKALVIGDSDDSPRGVKRVVIRGEGPDKTIIRSTSTTEGGSCIAIGTKNLYSTHVISPKDSARITDDYTPVGRMYVTVDDAGKFTAGDMVYISIPTTLDWINCIKMDQISPHKGEDTTTVVQWSDNWYEGQHRRYPRVVEYVEGNKVYLDHPVVRAIENKHIDSFGKEYDFGGGLLVRYVEYHPFTSECGVENLGFTSVYDSTKTQNVTNNYLKKTFTVHNDRNHRETGVSFTYCRNCWMRDVETTILPRTMVMGAWAMQCQVENCKNLHPVDIVTGSHLYAYEMVHTVVGGLVKNCYCTHSRHSFATAGDILGPAVYLRCVTDTSFSETGPHSAYCTGLLYDNVKSNHAEIEAYDRAFRGGGQGWTAGNMIMWNCEAPKTVCQDPWTSAHNWAVGCTGTHQGGNTNVINYTNFMGEDADHPMRPDGIWYSQGAHVEPESLFESQLAVRHSLGNIVFGSTGELIQEIMDK